MARLEWDSRTKTRVEKARSGPARPANGHHGVAQVPGLTRGIAADSLTANAAGTARLDAITDNHHWTYKVPGAIAVLALAWLAVCIVALPRGLHVTVQLLAGYLTLRFLLIVLFYPVGRWRIRRAERHANALAGRPSPTIPGLDAAVHHIVVVPNYKEPLEVLARTLDRLAAQDHAKESLTVVLAMEESEQGSPAKGHKLAQQYAGQFARVLVTVHPHDLAGEELGKGSNEAWAARQAKRELVDSLGLPIGSLTITSCDADSLFHPHYFADLGRQFAADPDRYHRFWQAPFRFSNNVWDVPAPIRMLGLLNNMVQVSELANPLAVNLPLSTYSLSLQLAHNVGYWDEAVIAEDWHMFLRSLFGSEGRTRLRVILLPTTGDAVGGPTFARGLQNAYRQRVRHAWGSSDIGYILQQWGRQKDVPLHRKLLFLVKVIHDHTFFTLAGVILGVGSVAVLAQRGLAGIAQPGLGLYDTIFQVANVVTGAGTAGAWLYEHLACRREAPGWSSRRLLGDVVMWPLLAVATLILVIAPTLEAQWRQMLGGALKFSVTSKIVPRTRS